MILRSLFAGSTAGVILTGCAALAAADGCPDLDLSCTDSNGANQSWAWCATHSPAKPQPVLFVHGHDFQKKGGNFKRNWQERATWTDLDDCEWVWVPPKLECTTYSLPSVKEALEANRDLGLEPYYIAFGADKQDRSLEEDADEIGCAVDRILARHAAAEVPVEVVLVGYSRGTISSRSFIRRRAECRGDNCPALGVSEFITLAPANHGLVISRKAVKNDDFDFDLKTSLALRQLNDGYDANCPTQEDPQASPRRLCSESNLCRESVESSSCRFRIDDSHYPCCQEAQYDAACTESESLDFITGLNTGDEAPGSRQEDASRAEGVLYLSLFANDARDSVGGSGTSDDCLGRRVARNRSPDAVNREVSQIPGKTRLVVHGNTVHTPEVICLALYTAAHHHLPPDEGWPCCRVPVENEPDRSKWPLCGHEDVPVVPAHPGVTLLFDTSGSMSRTPDGSRVADKNGSRLGMAIRAAHEFLDLLVVTGKDDTHFSVAAFPVQPWTVGTACGGQQKFPMSLVGDLTVKRAKETVGNLKANGDTPLLAGLATAAATFGGEDGRAIVLLTDGYHNCDRLGETLAGVVEKLRQDGARVYPVGFGRPEELDPSFLKTLADDTCPDDLADGACGRFYNVTYREPEDDEPTEWADWNAEADVELRKTYKAVLTEALGLELDLQQVVDPSGWIEAGQTITESISVSGYDRRVTFVSNWATPGDERLGLEVLSSDRQPVSPGTPGVTGLSRSTYSILSIDESFLRRPGKVGEHPWTVTLRLAEGQREYYQLGVLVESALRLDTALDRAAYAAGETVTLTARLTAGGKPLPQGAIVGVQVGRPEDGRGNWFARHRVTEEELETVGKTRDGEPLPRALRKALYLAGVPEAPFPGRLAPFTLQMNDGGVDGDVHSGDGVYTARFDRTGREGTYSFRVLAGNRPGAPPFQREQVIHELLTVQPVADATRVEVREIEGDESVFRVLITPRDALGNHLGPAWGESIRVTAANARLLDDAPYDLLDGSYSVDLILGPGVGPEDVEVQVDARGARRDFNLADELRPASALSLRLGWTAPRGALNRGFNGGPSFGLDFERPLSSALTAVARADVHTFDAAPATGPDTWWISLSGNLKYGAGGPTVGWYAAGGAGLYLPRSGSSRPGANLELGLDVHRGARWRLNLGAAYHRVFSGGPDAEFADSVLRLIYRLR